MALPAINPPLIFSCYNRIMRALIADDEKDLNAVISRTLEDEGYAVDSVYDGISALEYLEATPYDVAVLDIMMPGIDGIEVIRRFRSSGGTTPILLLTARDSVNDRVNGLDSGADDYLVKPFMFPELLARLRVLLRYKTAGERSAILRCGPLTLDPASHKVTRSGRPIDLSAKEFSILEYMMRNCGTILSRDSIRNHIWSWDYEGESNVVDVYIRYLRKKIDDGEPLKLIHTIRGAGYMITGEDR